MRRHRGPITDHFDGSYFYNPYYPSDPIQPPRRWEVLRWLATRKIGPWQDWTESKPGPPPPERVKAPELHATFIGHSSVLLQIDDFNILCDPHWSERASPVSFLGPRRHCAPGLKFEELPPIDVVLASHDHYDHFDVPTLRRVAKAWNPHLVVPLGVRTRLAKHGISNGAEVTELDWWQMLSISPDAYGDVRAGAAFFWSRIGRSQPHFMEWLRDSRFVRRSLFCGRHRLWSSLRGNKKTLSPDSRCVSADRLI